MKLTQCPHCESDRVARDYAPARSYALMLVGLAMILPRDVLSPELFSPLGQAHLQRFFVFGIALVLYGFLDTFRHGRRYCTDCGTAFRQPRSTPPGVQIEIRGVDRKAARVRPATVKKAAESGADDSDPVDPNTPVEPLLKCLRFKNETMREDAAVTLRKLTGQDFGTDADAWDAWWTENKDDYKAGKRS